MWATNYEWFGILSSISDSYSIFYDSTYLFDYHYYPLMTIVCYQPLMAVSVLGRMVSFISICHSSYNEFPSDYLSKPLFSLGYTPFALWTSPQWNRICEYSVTVLSTTNKRIISLSLTCQRNTTCNLYCFQMTLKYHIPAHSLCFLDTIIQPNQHHSPEYSKPSGIDIIIISPICNWNSIMT